MTTVEKFEKNIDQVNSDFQAIKSKLIECGVEVPDGTKTAELAEKVGEVFDAGKNSEWDAFWEAFQQGGTRTEYSYAFERFPISLSKPKYPNINASSAFCMFAYSDNHIDARIDLTEWAHIDFSSVKSFTMTFYRAAISKIGVVDMRGANNSILAETFAYCSDLQTIEELILREDIKFSNTFVYLTNLEKLIVSGVIGQNGLDLHWSTKLSKASITSIINALSTTTNDLTVTLSKTAVDNAFEGGSGGGVFHYLIDSKENWTISLI